VGGLKNFPPSFKNGQTVVKILAKIAYNDMSALHCAGREVYRREEMLTILIATCPYTGGIRHLVLETGDEISQTEAEMYVEMGARLFDCT
jgi:hypothetical protein